jgi:hypothetical protein
VRRYLAPLPLIALLVGCGAKPPTRPPLVVQVESIGEADFNPSIEVISVLELHHGCGAEA